MKTSELIEKLNELMKEVGDKEIAMDFDAYLIHTNDCYYDLFNDVFVITEL